LACSGSSLSPGIFSVSDSNFSPQSNAREAPIQKSEMPLKKSSEPRIAFDPASDTYSGLVWAKARRARGQSRQSEFETECPGYCGAQDTFYVGTLIGVGRVYQQTFIDTYAKVGFAKLYDRKTPITAADLLNDRVLPFYEENGVAQQRILTHRGTEYCSNPEHHEYELYLARISTTPEPRPRAHKRWNAAVGE
jgi:transposase InsO family protein